MNATALRRTACWRDVTRVSAILAVSVTALWTAPAIAQAPAWPTDNSQPKQGPGGPAWPADGGQQPRSATAPSGAFGPQQQPAGFGPPPQPGGFGPPQGGRPMGGPPAGNQAELDACNSEFNRLRADVDKHGLVAKKISERKGAREELCKAVTSLHGAFANWAKYAKSKVTTCGIPDDAVKQLNAQRDQLAKVKGQVCNAGIAGGAAPAARVPSLSEALGTTKLPDQSNTSVKRGGTLDTLTGNPIR